jgi:predicted alpha-1,2-mannosidase
MIRYACITAFIAFCLNMFSQEEIVWKIGEKDHSSADLALGPAGYEKFLENDFGYEDRYFLAGRSPAGKDFPYTLPGPDDSWGGTGGTSGWRTHEINILFGLDEIQDNTDFHLIIDFLAINPNRSLFKTTINDKQSEKQLLKGNAESTLIGTNSTSGHQTLNIPIKRNVIKSGGNKICLTILEGSWIIFDDVRLESNKKTGLRQAEKVFIREVKAAGYGIEKEGKLCQPLLVDVEHLSGRPEIDVILDGKRIFHEVIDTARYQFEALMPPVSKIKKSKYNILIDGVSAEKGEVTRSPQKKQTMTGYVDTKIGTAHSRWMIAPGPWMPFGMVKISPDNQNMGWQAGYQPSFETVGCFSHIHEWTMGGLGMMPTNGKLETTVGDQFDANSGYRSRIDKETEEAPLGYYKVHLTDTDIWAEITATTRCSFQRYTFPKDKDGRVMIDLHIQAEYDYQLLDVEVVKVNDYRLEGRSHQISPRPMVWSEDADQEYTLHFVIEFDSPIKAMGGWTDNLSRTSDAIKGKNLKEAGVYVEFDTKIKNVVQARTGISLVNLENAAENLEKEISVPFGWDYRAVVENQKNVWNELLSRALVSTSNRMEKVRFYTNMYRALSRNTWSDVNGEWVAADKTIRKFSNPEHLALGCDAFWNTFWNLNQFWNLFTPEWSSKWVNSQLAMYDANGWLAKGPAGMKYIPVMVAEHEIPLIVSAYQMGIRDFDANKAFEAVKKMQTTPATQVAGGFAGNRDLISYMKYKYVPSDLGRFSNTLEYAYDDWTVAQLAKALGKEDEYKIFGERGEWWRNAINPANGYAHLRESNGKFVDPFDPFHSGANHQYVEGNAWQLSYFVPQDVPALAKISGEKNFTERLNRGFITSEPWRYNAPNDQYWDFPVVHGNQQSMHFAFLFNWVKHPWLTQKWTRSIIDNYYGYGNADAYLGDEDQGQMSAWFVMAAIGLFQTDGGCNIQPVYEIASPLFEKTVINLGNKYGRGKQFVIEAVNVSRINKYIQSASLNGKELKSFRFPASELLKGGKLILHMGDKPNMHWGIELND